MSGNFYGYTVEKTQERDMFLLLAWSTDGFSIKAEERLRFWLKQGDGCESFVVREGKNTLGFFQAEHVGAGDQVRIHMQASPLASPKAILRGISKLVPLIEKALALRGVRAIFFTSHSSAMAQFMAERHGYERAGDGGADGMIMAKGIGQPLTPGAERAGERGSGVRGAEPKSARAAL